MKNTNDYTYVYLNTEQEYYIKLKNKFCIFHDDTNTIMVAINLLWDNINVYQSFESETFIVGTYAGKELYNKYMKSDWTLTKKQKGKIDE